MRTVVAAPPRAAAGAPSPVPAPESTKSTKSKKAKKKSAATSDAHQQGSQNSASNLFATLEKLPGGDDSSTANEMPQWMRNLPTQDQLRVGTPYQLPEGDWRVDVAGGSGHVTVVNCDFLKSRLERKGGTSLSFSDKEAVVEQLKRERKARKKAEKQAQKQSGGDSTSQDETPLSPVAPAAPKEEPAEFTTRALLEAPAVAGRSTQAAPMQELQERCGFTFVCAPPEPVSYAPEVSAISQATPPKPGVVAPSSTPREPAPSAPRVVTTKAAKPAAARKQSPPRIEPVVKDVNIFAALPADKPASGPSPHGHIESAPTQDDATRTFSPAYETGHTLCILYIHLLQRP